MHSFRPLINTWISTQNGHTRRALKSDKKLFIRAEQTFSPGKHPSACTFVSVYMCECCLCANPNLPHFSRLAFGRNARRRLITEQIVSVLKSNFHDLFAYLRIINNRPRGPRDAGASCHRLMLDPGWESVWPSRQQSAGIIETFGFAWSRVFGGGPGLSPDCRLCWQKWQR